MPDKTLSLKTVFILFLLVSLIFTSYLVLANNAFTSSLEPQYFDHLRHQRFAFEFLSEGMSIFSTPMKELVPIGNPAYYGWSEIPEFYPMGIVIFFIPFSILAFNSIIDPTIINKLTIIIFLLFAHLAIYLYTSTLFNQSYDKTRQEEHGVTIILIVIFYIYLIIWSLNGQYEAIPVFFVILSLIQLKKKNCGQSVFWYVIAIFFKYQAIFLLPIYLFVAYRLIGTSEDIILKIKNSSKMSKLLIGVTIGISFINVYTFLKSLPSLSHIPIENPFYILSINLAHILSTDQTMFILLALITTLFAVLNFISKDFTFGALVCWLFATIVFSKQFQMWYMFWFFLPLIICTTSTRRLYYSLWLVGVIYCMSWIPNLNYLISLIIMAGIC